MEQELTCLRTSCSCCGYPIAVAYRTQRTITTLLGSCRLTLRVRRCRNPAWAWYHRPYRPEEEGKWALPHGEFGLDVIALVGSLRYTAHQSIPEIHQALRDRGVPIAERTVTHLLQRYEELVTLHLSDWRRLRVSAIEAKKMVISFFTRKAAISALNRLRITSALIAPHATLVRPGPSHGATSGP